MEHYFEIKLPGDTSEKKLAALYGYTKAMYEIFDRIVLNNKTGGIVGYYYTHADAVRNDTMLNAAEKFYSLATEELLEATNDRYRAAKPVLDVIENLVAMGSDYPIATTKIRDLDEFQLWAYAHIITAWNAGNMVRVVRTLQDESMQGLADKCNFGKTNIQRIESGQVDPRATSLQAISTALNCSVDLLLAAPNLKK